MNLKPFKDIKSAYFSYKLPEERIALFPEENRDNSRLLIRYSDGTLVQDRFRNVASYLPAGTHLFLNDSKVIPARLIFKKETGSLIEVLCLQPDKPSDYALSLSATRTCTWQCMIGNMKRFGAGTLQMEVHLNDMSVVLKAEKISQSGDTALVRFLWNGPVSFAAILSKIGQTPLPPYIKREEAESDRERYQTIYSRSDGSVAAPTAGLHFTNYVFEHLKSKSIYCHELTLHVGAGTFQPLKSTHIRDHDMHAETFMISGELIHQLAKLDTKATCVGTTSVRTLESLYWLGVKILHSRGLKPQDLHLNQWEAYHLPLTVPMKESFNSLRKWIDNQPEKEIVATTKLMIVPGYDFKTVNAMITNFHQPRSTLLLLIAAFIGDSWKDTYRFALKKGFRFLSYGDSSLLFR